MSSASRSGCSARISATDIASATIATTDATGKRRSRTHGTPPIRSASAVIRVKGMTATIPARDRRPRRVRPARLPPESCAGEGIDGRLDGDSGEDARGPGWRRREGAASRDRDDHNWRAPCCCPRPLGAMRAPLRCATLAQVRRSCAVRRAPSAEHYVRRRTVWQVTRRRRARGGHGTS